MRVIVVVIVVRRVAVVAVAVGRLRAVDVDVDDVPAIVGLALPGQVALPLPAIAAIAAIAAAVTAARRDTADSEPAVRARLDSADAKNPTAAVPSAITVGAIA